MTKRILVVEPYYGGSHKHFLKGLKKNIEADFVFITLPARKWKMRMQLSAPWFADCITKMENRFFDTVLCSTFVDVAVLKALLFKVENWNNSCIFCTYFHENQFVYPSQIIDKSLQQFAAINFTTALSSNRLAFNSLYNKETFFKCSSRYLKRAADMDFGNLMHRLEEKTTIIFPGIDFGDICNQRKRRNSIPVICWNHRWEHDKDPDSFFNALYELERRRYDFKIVVLGQSFQKNPECFSRAKEHFKDKIIHFGFAESRDDYLSFLQKSDIVVSTALHEFFGISILEAVASGCNPLVPDRLSYPELYPEEFRYGDGELVSRLALYLEEHKNSRDAHCAIDIERFSWKKLKGNYLEWLF